MGGAGAVHGPELALHPAHGRDQAADGHVDAVVVPRGKVEGQVVAALETGRGGVVLEQFADGVGQALGLDGLAGLDPARGDEGAVHGAVHAPGGLVGLGPQAGLEAPREQGLEAWIVRQGPLGLGHVQPVGPHEAPQDRLPEASGERAPRGPPRRGRAELLGVHAQEGKGKGPGSHCQPSYHAQGTAQDQEDPEPSGAQNQFAHGLKLTYLISHVIFDLFLLIGVTFRTSMPLNQ